MSLPKLSVFVAFVLTSLFLGKSVAAQIPVPPQPVECNDTDPEFHSLRPYQASPCNTSVSGAAFCGNGIAISEQVATTQSLSPNLDPDCTLLDARTRRYKCIYDIHRGRTIAVDLSNAELPILGNTEKVINSQQQSEDLDSAEKTNEYVSWYLNGVTGRAEYGVDDINDTVNFSGPLKKLLPQSIQYKYQIETIEKALAKDINKDGEAQDRERHNQTVVCTNLLDKPTACYGSFLRELVNKEYRLDDWDGTLIAAQIRNFLINFWTSLLPDYSQEIIGDALGDVWEYKTPPLPWQDRFKDNPKKYLKAYNEWRGKTCILIPFVNLLICHDLPILSPDNKWADLFPYIPFSSTEDREGSVAISEFGIRATSPDAEVLNPKFTNQNPAELFFAHTEEVSDLASLLQSTYAPSGGSSGSAPSVGIAPNNCSLVNIRSNPGDQLFPGEISGDLSYDIEFSCDYEIPDTGWKPKECKKDVLVSLGTITKTPKADEIWSKLVAGPQGVFKRIYPKIDANSGPIGCLLDIPGATGVTYSGSGVSVSNPGERAGTPAELYFSHIGGVYEYFLKGIQTILRPKGFGEPIVYGAPGDPLCQLALSSNICTDDCNSDPTNVDMTGVQPKFVDLANRWLGVGKPRIDKYDQVVSAAKTRGVDPIFALAIWLHETGASNYQGICLVQGASNPDSDYCKWAYDFGVADDPIRTEYNASGIVTKDSFNAQLNAFVNLPGFYISTCGADNAGCPMETFGAKYRDGSCSPSNASNGYVSAIKEIYRWLSPTQKFPCYPSRVSQ